MELENRTPDETVNYTIEHPLKEFAWLLGGITAVVVIATALIAWFAGGIAAWLPYRYERELADGVGARLHSPARSAEALAAERALNELAARLVREMALPEGMQVTVHYDDGDMVNAFATLGANVVVFRGLIAGMPDENALAMVLAHEIAHAKLRHPARALGRGVAVGIVLSVVSTGMGKSAAGNVLGPAGGLTLLSFSREQEREADEQALQALWRVYGHVGGASDVFRILSTANGRTESGRIAMLTTHPLSDERIENIGRLARDHGWPADGPRQPMPDTLAGLKPK